MSKHQVIKIVFNSTDRPLSSISVRAGEGNMGIPYVLGQKATPKVKGHWLFAYDMSPKTYETLSNCDGAPCYVFLLCNAYVTKQRQFIKNFADTIQQHQYSFKIGDDYWHSRLTYCERHVLLCSWITPKRIITLKEVHQLCQQK